MTRKLRYIILSAIGATLLLVSWFVVDRYKPTVGLGVRVEKVAYSQRIPK